MATMFFLWDPHNIVFSIEFADRIRKILKGFGQWRKQSYFQGLKNRKVFGWLNLINVWLGDGEQLGGKIGRLIR